MSTTGALSVAYAALVPDNFKMFDNFGGELTYFGNFGTFHQQNMFLKMLF